MDKIRPTSEQFLIALNGMQDRMERLQAQVSSGVRISTSQDDPSNLPRLVALETSSKQNEQIARNLTVVKNEVDTAEGALQDAVTILEKARSLGLQGGSTANAATQRADVARQVESLLNRMVDLSRTQAGGRFLFSGDNSSSPVYTVNLDAATGVDRLFTPESTRLIQHPSGTSFAVEQDATQLFDVRDANGDPAAGNSFAALQSLRVALNANDQSGINTAISSLRTASDWMNDKLAWYGDIQTRLAAATATAQKFQVQQTIAIGQIRDTDLTAAITELSQNKVSQQAALSAEATFKPMSLFDFLR